MVQAVSKIDLSGGLDGEETFQQVVLRHLDAGMTIDDVVDRIDVREAGEVLIRTWMKTEILRIVHWRENHARRREVGRVSSPEPPAPRVTAASAAPMTDAREKSILRTWTIRGTPLGECSLELVVWARKNAADMAAGSLRCERFYKAIETRMRRAGAAKVRDAINDAKADELLRSASGEA